MNQTIEQQLAENGFYVSTTVGTSMRPMLRNRRDRVIIRPTDGARLSKWDLPLYKRPDGKYILHRIIGVRDGYYIIRGDNTYAKEKVPDEWIIGVMTEFYRGNRHGQGGKLLCHPLFGGKREPAVSQRQALFLPRIAGPGLLARRSFHPRHPRMLR